VKIVFLGTPEISCFFLDSMMKEGYIPEAVISRPDKAAGRGLNICPSPLSKFANQKKLRLFHPCSGKEIKEVLSNLKPDLCVAVAYGRFIPEGALKLARIGFLNVHFSLLPKYRGAAPVQWALINGEKESGVSIFWIDKEMDAGPLFVQEKVGIKIEDDARSLLGKMCPKGTRMLMECLGKIEKGQIIRIPQKGEVSYAPKVEKSFSWIDFSDSAMAVYNKIRGLCLGPGARFLLRARQMVVQVLKAEYRPGGSNSENFVTGQICLIERNKGFYIKCSDECLFISRVHPEGKKEMNAFDFINGLRLKAGDTLRG